MMPVTTGISTVGPMLGPLLRHISKRRQYTVAASPVGRYVLRTTGY